MRKLLFVFCVLLFASCQKDPIESEFDNQKLNGGIAQSTINSNKQTVGKQKVLPRYTIEEFKQKVKELEGTLNTQSTNKDVVNPTPITMMTLNTQLMDTPNIFNGPQCDGAACQERALSLCDYANNEVSRQSILLFQEAFDNTARGTLVNCVESAGYVCLESDNGQGLEEGAGLVTCFDQAEIQNIGSGVIEFDNCSNASGDDCWAQKGLLYSLFYIKRKNRYIYVINTHMDAGVEMGDIYARHGQILQIRSIVRFLTKPVVLGGDFNIDAELSPASGSQFEYLLERWEATASFQFVNKEPSPTADRTPQGHHTKVLDYFVFVQPPNSPTTLSGIQYTDFGFSCKNPYFAVKHWVRGSRNGIFVTREAFKTYSGAQAFAEDKNNPTILTQYSTHCGTYIDYPGPDTDHLPSGTSFYVY